MGKGNKGSRHKAKKGESWGSEDHRARLEVKQKQQKQQQQQQSVKPPKKQQKKSKQNKNNNDNNDLSYSERRRLVLTRNSANRLEESKLRLHIRRIQKEVNELRSRLLQWDDVEEEKKQRQAEEEERKKKRQNVEGESKKGRKKRKCTDPNTWKVCGAARPAWEVYDFDVRHVDPFLKAHEDAKAKAARSTNIFKLYSGHFADIKQKQPNQQEEEEAADETPHTNKTLLQPPQPYCRKFLSLLIQLGHLHLEGKQYKAAREAFLECIELEGTHHPQPCTPARSRLMCMYVQANRPDSARRLWNRLLPTDTSAWVRYTAALFQYVSWSIQNEEGSSQESAQSQLILAMKANPFVAYYLSFPSTFENVVEYADDIEDADHGTILEAIEYCSSEQMGAWIGTDGAVDFVRNLLLGIRNADHVVDAIDRSHLIAWEEGLKTEEEDDEESGTKKNPFEEEVEEDDDEDGEPDVLMYKGMFRTAMNMLEDSGELNKMPSVIVAINSTNKNTTKPAKVEGTQDFSEEATKEANNNDDD